MFGERWRIDPEGAEENPRKYLVGVDAATLIACFLHDT